MMSATPSTAVRHAPRPADAGADTASAEQQLEIDIGFGLRSFALDVSLRVGRETLALVGPSGAGKTTVLRAVAGLRRPDRGRIALGGRAWFDGSARIDLPPESRSVGLVFQEYALFPHMTVRANVAFGADRAGKRVDELLERFGISHFAGERPTHLSGGERQRVALARALARDPSVLLLDEPLSALDAHTRAIVRGELQDLLAELALPTLLVTHDFRDAVALADRVGVVVDGTLRQLGTAAQLVERPADAFVVSLTGGNLLHGTARPVAGGGSEVRLADGTLLHSDDRGQGRVGLAVYPWEITIEHCESANGALNAIVAPVGSLTPEGGRVRVRIGSLTAEASTEHVERIGLRRGEPARACFASSSARLVALADLLPEDPDPAADVQPPSPERG